MIVQGFNTLSHVNIYNLGVQELPLFIGSPKRLLTFTASFLFQFGGQGILLLELFWESLVGLSSVLSPVSF